MIVRNKLDLPKNIEFCSHAYSVTNVGFGIHWLADNIYIRCLPMLKKKKKNIIPILIIIKYYII